MRPFLSHYYIGVSILTALYCGAFIAVLSPRFRESKPIQSFTVFLAGLFAWSLEDSLAGFMGAHLDSRTLVETLVVISPLSLFLPNFAFDVLITTHNAAAAPSNRFARVAAVHMALAAVSTALFIASLLDNSLMYRAVAWNGADYTSRPGIGLAVWCALLGAAGVIPGTLLVRTARRTGAAGPRLVAGGAVAALLLGFAGNAIPSMTGLPLPRLGCLLTAAGAAAAFYGMLRQGISAASRAGPGSVMLDKLRDNLRSVAGAPDDEGAYQSICEGVREFCGALLACLVTFERRGREYRVRAISHESIPAHIVSRLSLHPGSVNALAPSCALGRQAGTRESVAAAGFGELLGASVNGTDPAAGIGISRIVCLPVIADERIRGALLVCSGDEIDGGKAGVFADLAGLVMEFFVRIEEIEESRRISENAAQTQKMDAVGQLAGGIAHDFNNLLSGISGFAELLKRRHAKERPELAKLVDPIVEAAARGAELTKRLLAFARKGKYRVTAVNMGEIIETVAQLLGRTIGGNITIRKEIASAAPAVLGDPSQLQDALLNLAINARDAMPDGGELRLALSHVVVDDFFVQPAGYRVENGEYLLLEVADSGVGMSDETKARMFEPFFTTKEVGKGSGLGLASVYGCVKNHNGYITVDSSPDHGTAVKIYLPAAATEAPQPVSAQGSGELVKGKEHVLVIDDEEIVRNILREMLTELGYSVSLCVDGAEGVEYYRGHHGEIDLVIVDMIMPRMGGHECLKALRAINHDVKVVLSTGYSVAEDTQRMIRGISGFVQKPFDMGDLSKIVAEAIHGTGLRGGGQAG